MKSREQKLIDILFEIAFVVHEDPQHFDHLSREEFAQWISSQLKTCGFEGAPIGASWHVLNTSSGK